MRRAVCISLLLLLFSTVCSADPKDELKGVRKEISAKKQLITKTRKVEAEVSTELQGINLSLDRKKADLTRLSRDLQVVETSLSHTGGEISRVSSEAARKKQEIERRLSSLYKAGELGTVRMFFSAGSIPQMAENVRYMRSVVDNDRRIIADYNQKLDELRNLKGSLEKDAQRKERIKGSIELKKREIEQEKGKKSAYLQKVRQDRKGYEASLKELQANASRLESMIGRLESRSRRPAAARQDKQGSRGRLAPELPPVPDRGFASQKGRMPLPVRGSIQEAFGKHKHPEFNTYTFSKGFSISAAAGSEIRSIYDGSVIFADYFKGYGNMIIVDHGGGYISLYAHASRLLKRVGAEVSRNDVIAAVGDVDSSRGPMLYFEIRHQGKPVDPAGWVR